eukprot:TRINITY_DN1117_c0_g1_i8.p1 TRINITY_DN1117_c0_g1~~TRINITY_DN1117_c0_g1_i8.p1  ORF type:complete len:425 (+),score=67.87 TRINITY_DN1117_c0_g1_i8:111-1277(+)
MAKSYDVSSSQTKRPRDSGQREMTLPCVFKILTPAPLASAVIGKGGAVIASWRATTQAKLGLTAQGQVFPNTNCRILTVQAYSEEAINEVIRLVIGKLVECAENTPSEELGYPDAAILRVLLPRIAVGGVIGVGGRVIKALRETSGAKITVNDANEPGVSADQIIVATGNHESLMVCCREFNKQVQAIQEEPWFPQWASNNSGFSDGADVSRGGTPSRGGGGSHAAPWAGGNGGNDGGYSSRGGGGYGGVATYGGGGGASSSGGMDLLYNIASELPSYVMEDSRGFALSCAVPNAVVGGLIGRGGAGTKEIQNLTGTKIAIREVPGDLENRSLNISGPLANTCAAYMLMMKRYLDAEAEIPHSRQAPVSSQAPPTSYEADRRSRRPRR